MPRSAISGVFSRAVCKYKFKAICCSFNSTPSETFDKIVFLGRHFAEPSDLPGAGSVYRFKGHSRKVLFAEQARKGQGSSSGLGFCQ